MSALPASDRISAASFSTRFAILLALNFYLIFSTMLQHHLEQLTRGAGHLKAVRFTDADDLTITHDQRQTIPHLGRDFTINQDFFDLFVFEAVAGAPVSDDEG